MHRLTLFSWGYHGWGNATEQFVKMADTVERSRGFEPPLFVDIRIQRSVRAVGFQGATFKKRLGSSRYRWLPELGNLAVKQRTGPMRIAEPAAANDLLQLAVEEARQNRRVLFFCGCQWPKVAGKIACHRTLVVALLLKAADRQRVPVEIVEWPGGRRRHIELTVKPDVLKSLAKAGSRFRSVSDQSWRKSAAFPGARRRC